MIIGVPQETQDREHRVGLTPSGAGRLVAQGHEVLVEAGAGAEAHFTDEDYARAGARTVYSAEEVYQRADLVCRIGRLGEADLELAKPGAMVASFHHLAVAPRALLDRMLELELSVIGYEVIEDASGALPVLVPLSEIAGHLAVHTAAHLLQNESGGRGILLGNVPGVPPPTVLVLGAGTAGRAAAEQALATGAHVLVADIDLARLRAITRELPGVVTAVASRDRIERLTAIADIVVGAVLVPGGRAPYLVTEEMVARMKAGSVVVDLAIDQGGCVETSRPTTLVDPTYVVHGVTHYAVPNMTANVARTASRAFSNAALPYLAALAGAGVEEAARRDPGLARGVYLHRGGVTDERLAAVHGLARHTIGANEEHGEDDR